MGEGGIILKLMNHQLLCYFQSQEWKFVMLNKTNQVFSNYSGMLNQYKTYLQGL